MSLGVKFLWLLFFLNLVKNASAVKGLSLKMYHVTMHTQILENYAYIMFILGTITLTIQAPIATVQLLIFAVYLQLY